MINNIVGELLNNYTFFYYYSLSYIMFIHMYTVPSTPPNDLIPYKPDVIVDGNT